LTFCPPGPEERMKRSSISFSLMEIVSVTRIIIRSFSTRRHGEHRDYTEKAAGFLNL
jgi:hypothetical protein